MTLLTDNEILDKLKVEGYECRLMNDGLVFTRKVIVTCEFGKNDKGDKVFVNLYDVKYPHIDTLRIKYMTHE